jgi:glyoxalase-like protein
MNRRNICLRMIAVIVIAATVAVDSSSSAMASAPVRQASAATGAGVDSTGLDHVLLWARDMDHATAVMAVKLGFQVRPGRDPSGIANRYVRMADRSFIELEALTRPSPEMDPGSRADQDLLHGGSGARTFGLGSHRLEQARDFLKGKEFVTTDIFSAPASDPDGQGAGHPPRWRLFAFNQQPLSSGLFFIDYAAPSTAPDDLADDAAARTHPNTARSLDAVWLLSADAGADQKQLAKMGFTRSAPLRLVNIAARGYDVDIGGKHIFLLQPDGAGVAADALASGGAQILGVSVAVDNLPRARRWVERGYEKKVTGYRGPLGDSFLAPTNGDLGLWVEFHAPSGH